MKYEEYKKKKLSNNRLLQAEYLRLSRERNLMYSIARQVKEQRLRLKLTQDGLAQRVSTHQSGIARLENGSALPSLSFLLSVVEALGCELKFQLTEHQTAKNENLKVKPLNRHSVNFVLVPQQSNKAETTQIIQVPTK
ncbi:MAG TPA: helix-turn-helix transcriptional regulator [Candidatus Paceibacterota bacterium]|nr:helix-turn-helix transcriptional regulator [Candidatus Paceibacterota bacterium]